MQKSLHPVPGASDSRNACPPRPPMDPVTEGKGFRERRRGRGLVAEARVSAHWGLRVAAVGVAALCMLPLLYLVMRCFELGADFWPVLLRERTARILWNSVVLAIAVTASSTVVGVLIAWLTMRTDLPGRQVWSVLTCLPLVLPSYVGAFSFIAAFGPQGLLQQILSPFGVERLPSIYGFSGAWLVLTLFTYPYSLLSARAGLRGVDPCVEDAARSLGRTGPGIFREIVLPHLRPAMAAGALLVALYTLSDFGAVSLLRYDAFTRAIYVQYTGALDRGGAAVLALVLVVLTFMILYGEYRMRGRGRYYRPSAGAMRRQHCLQLGPWRWPAIALLVFLTMLTLGVPVGVILYWMIEDPDRWVHLQQTLDMTLNSLTASGFAAMASVVAGVPVVIYAVRHPCPSSRWIERCAYVGHALPGIVVALALVFFGIRWGGILYQSIAMLVLAYVVMFIPLAVGNLRTALMNLSPRLEEAARTLGKTPRETFLSVTLPLLQPGVMAGMALVFLTSMKELPATLILGPTGFQTLATQIWSATEEAFFARAAAPALILLLVSGFSVWLILRHETSQE